MSTNYEEDMNMDTSKEVSKELKMNQLKIGVLI